jgi:hypothetical protein
MSRALLQTVDELAIITFGPAVLACPMRASEQRSGIMIQRKKCRPVDRSCGRRNPMWNLEDSFLFSSARFVQYFPAKVWQRVAPSEYLL